MDASSLGEGQVCADAASALIPACAGMMSEFSVRTSQIPAIYCFDRRRSRAGAFEMAEGSTEASLLRLIAAGERMASARSMDAVVAILRETARDIVGADGIAVILREGDICFYAAEDAVAP